MRSLDLLLPPVDSLYHFEINPLKSPMFFNYLKAIICLFHETSEQENSAIQSIFKTEEKGSRTKTNFEMSD